MRRLERRGVLASLGIALLATVAAVSTPLATKAEVVNNGGLGGCAWDDGPTTPDTACSYLAFALEGSAEWVATGNTQPASVTGAVAGTTCAIQGGVGGVCTYAQVPGGTVSVSAPSSIAGTAGSGAIPFLVIEPFSCVWVPLSGGCSYQVQESIGTLTGTVLYAGGNGIPTFTGVTSATCTAFTTDSGMCTYTAGTPTTVTVKADNLSAGLVVSHSAL
jgi:hypothetical protein